MKWDSLRVIFIIIFSVALLSACSSPAPTPQVVTVVNTVPIEVTRLVEIESTVLVVTEVVVTQIVEIPVTITPTLNLEMTSTPQVTSTQIVEGGTEIIFGTPTLPASEFKDEKIQGYSILKVINETPDYLSVVVSGPETQKLAVSGGKSVSQVILEGVYSYSVERDGQEIYQGVIQLTNPDKHELVIRKDKVIYRVP